MEVVGLGMAAIALVHGIPAVVVREHSLGVALHPFHMQLKWGTAVQQHNHYCTTTKLSIRMAACHSVKLSIIIILFIQVTMIHYYNSIMYIVDRIVNKKT